MRPSIYKSSWKWYKLFRWERDLQTLYGICSVTTTHWQNWYRICWYHKSWIAGGNSIVEASEREGICTIVREFSRYFKNFSHICTLTIFFSGQISKRTLVFLECQVMQWIKHVCLDRRSWYYLKGDDLSDITTSLVVLSMCVFLWLIKYTDQVVRWVCACEKYKQKQ